MSLDGSTNVTLATTVQPNSVALGSDTTGDYVSRGATSTNGISGSTSGESQTFQLPPTQHRLTQIQSFIVMALGTLVPKITANLSNRATVLPMQILLPFKYSKHRHFRRRKCGLLCLLRWC